MVRYCSIVPALRNHIEVCTYRTFGLYNDPQHISPLQQTLGTRVARNRSWVIPATLALVHPSLRITSRVSTRPGTMRLTTELINDSLSYLNPMKERELDLRGAVSFCHPFSADALRGPSSWARSGAMAGSRLRMMQRGLTRASVHRSQDTRD